MANQSNLFEALAAIALGMVLVHAGQQLIAQGNRQLWR